MRILGLAVGAVALALVVPVAGASDAPASRTTADRGAASPTVAAPKELAPMAAAGVRARETGRRVEVSAFRTETSEIYVNPDGTKTMDQHPVPVRVRKGERWVTPDPTLRKGVDGSYQPAAAVTPIVLSGGGGTHLLTFGEPGKRVDLGWIGKLPAPVVTGSRAVYPEVFPGVDLQIDVGVNDFTHLLIVKNRQAALNPALETLRYPVSSDGLKLSVRPDGSTLATRNGRQVFSAPPPTMWDADGTPKRLGLKIAGKAMTLTPNAGMLSDPKTKFPVAIDPSLDGRLVNWAHVNVRMGAQTAWNYDRNDEGAKVGRAYQSTANLYRSMFLLNTTSGAQTIAGSQIVSAAFRITLNKTPSPAPGRPSSSGGSATSGPTSTSTGGTRSGALEGEPRHRQRGGVSRGPRTTRSSSSAILAACCTASSRTRPTRGARRSRSVCARRTRPPALWRRTSGRSSTRTPRCSR